MNETLRSLLAIKRSAAVLLDVLFAQSQRRFSYSQSRIRNRRAGYSLVEVLVAVTVLLVALVGPLTIAAKGLQNANFARQQNTAFFLAQEALEGVQKYREDGAVEAFLSGGMPEGQGVWNKMSALANLNCTAQNPCGIDVNNDFSIFRCGSNGRTCDIYRHETGRTRYNHTVAGGEKTSYRRELILDINPTRAMVRAIVTWGDSSSKTVELSTYIYNIYEK